MHIAGVFSIDNRPTWQTIRDAYGAQKLSTILEFKWSNLARLIGPEPLDVPSLNRTALEQTRIAQREYIWNAIGILNFGWLALAVLAIRRKGPVIPYSGWLLAGSVLNLVLFALILFGPASTVTTHSSYADILLISVALAGYFLALPRSILLIGFALQIFDLFVVWVWTPPISLHLPLGAALTPSIQIPQAVAALAFSGILAWHFGRSYFEPSKEIPLRAELVASYRTRLLPSFSTLSQETVARSDSLRPKPSLHPGNLRRTIISGKSGTAPPHKSVAGDGLVAETVKVPS